MTAPPPRASSGVWQPQSPVAGLGSTPTRKRPVARSATSCEPWEPAPHVAEPPYLAWDVAYAALGAGLAYWVLMRSSFAAPLLAVPEWAAQFARGDSVTAAVVTAAWAACVTPAVWMVVAVAAAVFRFFHGLEPVSYSRMLEAERVLLDTVMGDVQHHWSRFQTQHATWHIHSLSMQGKTEGGHAGPGGGVRPAVVLLHGHSAGAAHWEAVIDRIAEIADFYVLDLPGWGRSPMPDVLGHATSPARIVELQAEMLVGWLAANNLRRIVLVGHSFGGFHAVQFARRYPKIVEQVILVAPAGLAPVTPEGSLLWGTLYKFAPPQFIARTTGRLGFWVFKTLYLTFTVEDRRFPDFYYQLAAQTAATGCGDVVAGRFLRFNWRGGLWWSYPCLSDVMALDMPVSVIWGQRDDILPAIFGPLLHRIRPRTDLYLIKDALHNPAHNNARAFCDALGDCLLKYRGMPRFTLSGCADGTARCPDGTADELLEPTALPSRLWLPPGQVRSPVLAAMAAGAAAGGPLDHHLTLPPPVELARQLSHPEAAGAAGTAGRGVRVGERDAALGRQSPLTCTVDGPSDRPVPSAPASLVGHARRKGGAVAAGSTFGAATGGGTNGGAGFGANGAAAAVGSAPGGDGYDTGVRRRGVEGGITPPSPLDVTASMLARVDSSPRCSTDVGGSSAGAGVGSDGSTLLSRTPASSSAVSTPSSTSSRRSRGSSYLAPPQLPPMPAAAVVERVLLDTSSDSGGSAGVGADSNGHTHTHGNGHSNGTGRDTPTLAAPIARLPSSSFASAGMEMGDGVRAPLPPPIVSPVLQREPSAPWRGHDGVVTEFGRGRGFCHGCFRAVQLHKSYWRCSCAAWSFNANISDAETWVHFGALLAFLDELYVRGTFNARTSAAIVMCLPVRTPLPPPAGLAVHSVLPPAPDAESPSISAAGDDAPVTSAVALSKQYMPRVRMGSAPARASVAAASTASLPMPPPMRKLARQGSVSRDDLGRNSNGVVLPPAPARFPRGEVFLLE